MLTLSYAWLTFELKVSNLWYCRHNSSPRFTTGLTTESRIEAPLDYASRLFLAGTVLIHLVPWAMTSRRDALPKRREMLY
jgi:hypothetical protein